MRWLAIVSLILLVLVGTGGVCGWSAIHMGRDILNNQFQISNFKFQIFKWCSNGLPFVDKLEDILDNKTYIVLLQNNTELRPAGGFIGSYAVLEFQNSGLREIKIQDIYEPDGQLVGHVDPPMPIEQAFRQGGWKLRDSNWDPDFRIAAPQIAWFFEQGRQPVDGIVALNLSFITKWLETVGGVQPEGYAEPVTAKTLGPLAQKYAEVDFFPGSTQKRDYLRAVGEELVEDFKSLKFLNTLKLLKVIYGELKREQILVWFKDQDIQKEIEFRKWAGALHDYTDDYLYIVESNLGANKANCCVERSVTQDVTSNKTNLIINYKNNNEFTNPKPPVFWGGDYIDYLRIIVPVDSQIQSVSINNTSLQIFNSPARIATPARQPNGSLGGGQSIAGGQFLIYNAPEIKDDKFYRVETRDKYKIIGFWVVVPARELARVEMIYTTSPSVPPLSKGREAGRGIYDILVQRQPGIASLPYKLIYNGKIVIDANLDRASEFVVKSGQ